MRGGTDSRRLGQRAGLRGETRFGALGQHRVDSWTLAGLADAVSVLGPVTVLCGLGGLGDDNGDALAFTAAGAILTGVGLAGRHRTRRPADVAPRRVIVGIGTVWGAMIGLIAAVYLATGAVGRLDDAVVEAAAGLTTTAVTTLAVEEASRTVLLWRAATSWVGGLIAIVVALGALPRALGGTALLAHTTRDRWVDLMPTTAAGLRRVAVLYAGFTLACAAAYLAAGLGPTEAAVHGLGTASTGGFSSNADSFAGYGPAARAVATGAMIAAGAGVFAMWGAVRGRAGWLWRSQELRFYLAILAGATAILAIGVDGLGVGDALFTAASVSSTTGFATGEWTALGSTAAGVLLVAAGIGSMIGSAGGGTRVLRARLLVAFGGRELRRQLDPHAVVVVRHDRQPLGDRTLDRLGGYSVAHLAVIGGGALLLGAAGMSVPSGVWSAVSAVSTLGPAFGDIGAFGHLDGVTRPARLVLAALMVTGRVAILPLLSVIGAALQLRRSLLRRGRRLWREGGRARDG